MRLRSPGEHEKLHTWTRVTSNLYVDLRSSGILRCIYWQSDQHVLRKIPEDGRSHSHRAVSMK
jgi:hypothetical protein